MTVDREIHYQGEGVQALSDRLEAAIQAGDAQEAATAAFFLGGLRTFSLTGIPFLQENVRKRKQKSKRGMTAKARHKAVRDAYRVVPECERKRGVMSVYRYIARQSQGTDWKCSWETVRKILASDGTGND